VLGYKQGSETYSYTYLLRAATLSAILTDDILFKHLCTGSYVFFDRITIVFTVFK